MAITEFRFNGRTPQVTEKDACFSPPSFPPPDEWPVSIDRLGEPLSYYGSKTWDYRYMGGPIFNFGKHKLSENNESDLKKVIFCFLYDPTLFPSTVNTVLGYFYTFLKIAQGCDENGISMRNLHRFPRLFKSIGKKLLCARFGDRISHLHKWDIYSEKINLPVGGKEFVVELVKLGGEKESVQHPYVPQRIWSYQVNRLHQVLENFSRNQHKIERSYRWIVDAFDHNEKVVNRKYRSPFADKHLHRNKRIIWDGEYTEFLKSFGIYDVISDVMEIRPEIEGQLRLSRFTAYLTLVRDCSLIYIMNFSMQRMSEATALRSDCFSVEHDKNLGELCLISSETTKTIKDSDARWVVPKNVQLAVKVATFIAKLRLSALSKPFDIPKDLLENPFLLTPAIDPWSSIVGEIKGSGGNWQDKFLDFICLFKSKIDYSAIMRRNCSVFDDKQLRLSKDEARIAKSMTPNVDEKEWFGVGKPWRFSTHQIRRTIAVNMFISDDVSLGSLQDAMKHFTRNMTLYYLRNYANVRLDSKVSKTLIIEYYSSVGRNLLNFIEDDIEYVRPHGRSPELTKLIHLVDVTDERSLRKLAEKGDCGVRKTLLGFCVRTGECGYGGIESLVKCTGGDGKGKGVCPDAIFDTKNKTQLKKMKVSNDERIAAIPEDSPMHTKIRLENYAIEVYLDAISEK